MTTAAQIDRWRIYDTEIPVHTERGVEMRKVWDPHSGQLRITESRARNRVASCGRRFGKSDVGGKELVPYGFMAYYRQKLLHDTGKAMIYWIVGPEYSDAEKEFRVLWNTLTALGVPFDKPGSYYDAVGGNMHLSLWHGAFQVHGKSSKYPDTLVGEGLSGVIMAEAAKQKPSVWTKHVRPTLGDYTGWSLHTSTPEGKNHFHDKFQMGQDPNNPEWDSWRMPSWVNPYVYTITGRRIASGELPADTPIPDWEFTLDRDVTIMQQIMRENPTVSPFKIVEANNLRVDKEVIELAGDMSIESFNQEIGADFTEYVGKVFKDWDEEYHVGDLEFNPNWETYGACDYGYTNPNVWLLIQVGPWGEINVLREIYMEGLTADQFALEIKRQRLNPPGLHIFYPDPADPSSSRVLEDKLGIRAAGGTGGEKKIRINLIRQFLKRGRNDANDPSGAGWRPQLMFDRSCVQGRREMEAYRYPDSTDKPNPSSLIYEEPLKKDDHVPEALGRFFAGRYGPSALIREDAGGSRVSKANVDTVHAGRERRSSNAPKDIQYQRVTSNEPNAYQYKQVSTGWASESYE
ncbi:terminase large subunit [Mycobacterium phage Hawkeye]|uniref:Terminase large subunit n=1 Tax=Mycobacterium phage Hawkeye TaxID=1458711 RepID=X2KSZ3_9CAUD|nr:terminase large subunit [Mycobacterium phage Hawkeye]AHN84020.1 terminase large subunit [Mycobacterium phage Hawkeye]